VEDGSRIMEKRHHEHCTEQFENLALGTNGLYIYNLM